MFIHESFVRVRYSETDRMGYCYYGNYAQFFEIGRVEALRELGFPYKELEDEGVILPVLSFNIKYLRPAYYDDTLKIVTLIKAPPSTRFEFEYEVYNQHNEKITIGATTLVFIDKTTNKPTRAPKDLIEKLNKYI
jgi:acyl-CoA thioester hydrolase